MYIRMQRKKSFSSSSAPVAIGYYDRLQEETILIPIAKIIFPSSNRKIIQIIDSEGEMHFIPLHRIREIYRDGRLIWYS